MRECLVTSAGLKLNLLVGLQGIEEGVRESVSQDPWHKFIKRGCEGMFSNIRRRS